VAGDHAVEELALVDVAEVAADVLGVLAFGPQAAAMGEAHVGVLGRHGQHVRVEVAERGGEHQLGAVLRIMPVMVFCTAAVSGTFSSSTTLMPGIFLSGGGFELRLVVAVVVARADVDHADGDRLLREGEGAPAAEGAGGDSAARDFRVSRRLNCWVMAFSSGGS
jgi:hypothetical protein